MNKKTIEKIIFALDWSPNGHYLGAYVAISKNFFEEEGLEVSLTQIGEESVASLVSNGKAQFGYFPQEFVTLARAEKHMNPIVAVAAVIQHNTTGFAGLRSSGIQTPKDFEGKKYAALCNDMEKVTSGYDMEKHTLGCAMSAFGGDVNKVIFIAEQYDALKTDLLQGGHIDLLKALQSKLFDIVWVVRGWQVIEAQEKNLDLFFAPLVEIDEVFNTYEPLIISSEKYLSENRDTTMRFMRALKKGYEWSVKNPKESAHILYEAEPSLDKNLVLKSAQFLASKFIDDAPGWGVMKQERWDNYTDWLKEKGLIDSSFTIEGSYTNSFLQE